MSKPKTYVDSHVFNASPDLNGGEGLLIITEIHDNGDPTNNIFLNQRIELNSYGNSASINLCTSVLTPNILRRLADEIEAVIEINKKNT